MTVENRPQVSTRGSRLRKVGTTVELVGFGTGAGAGLLNQLHIAAVGGAVFVAGYGINRLADKRESREATRDMPQTPEAIT